MPRFSLQDVEHAWEKIDPVFLQSPQFECEPLSKLLGVQILLKVETLNPIRSFKGRGADLLVQQSHSPLVCASAGNFGQAIAYAARKRGLPVTVFASVQANEYKVERMRALGAQVYLHGNDFDAAKEEARQWAIKNDQRFVEDSRDVETAIGAGTIGLELIRAKNNLDVLLVPVGNGALINGIGRVFKDSGVSTRVVGVQSMGASAMLDSWRARRKITHTSINTIADGIGVRLPVDEALEDLYPVMDDGVLVSEENIIKAMKLLFQTAGLVTEPSGAVAIAALLEKPSFESLKVGVILCGSNLTIHQQKWLA
jgi:threonine dehydratase